MKDILKKIALTAGISVGVLCLGLLGSCSNTSDSASGGNGTSVSGENNSGGGNTNSTNSTGNTDSTSAGDSAVTGGAATYTFEAEYVDLSGVIGQGISGANAGIGMIHEGSKASNGYYLTDMYRTGCSISFVITADKEATATMKLSLGNSFAQMKLSDVLDITVNENAVTQKSSLKVEADDVASPGTEFAEYTISTSVSLAEGENTITFTVKENTYCNGGSGAPEFDALILTTEAVLTWTPVESNLDDFE